MNSKVTIKLNDIDKVYDFIKTTSYFSSDIDAIRGRYVIDAKSILGLFTINLSKPLDVVLHTNNIDELDKFTKEMEKYKWEK